MPRTLFGRVWPCCLFVAVIASHVRWRPTMMFEVMGPCRWRHTHGRDLGGARPGPSTTASAPGMR